MTTGICLFILSGLEIWTNIKLDLHWYLHKKRLASQGVSKIGLQACAHITKFRAFLNMGKQEQGFLYILGKEIFSWLGIEKKGQELLSLQSRRAR